MFIISWFDIGFPEDDADRNPTDELFFYYLSWGKLIPGIEDDGSYCIRAALEPYTYGLAPGISSVINDLIVYID